MYKVILVSNFNLDSVADKLYKEKLTAEEANRDALWWNKKYGGHNAYYYAKVVPQSHKLYEGLGEYL